MYHERTLPSQDQTQTLARRLAPVLGAGDCVLLNGPVGAGKTTFARALIRERQRLAGERVEDVPSPSFTLVQTYAAGSIEIWHVDLYRLTSADEVLELGLEAAFETAICLIEWPDILPADVLPGRHLRIDLTPDAEDAETRHAVIKTIGSDRADLEAALSLQRATAE